MSNNRRDSPSWWTPWLLLGAGAFLVGLIIFVTWTTFAATAPVCNRVFPARIGQYPSWLYVFSAVGAFAFGHALGQFRVRRNESPEEELGDGPWSKPDAVVAVNAGVAVFLLLVTVMLVVEAWTLGHNTWPITYYTRCATDANGVLALLGSAIFAFVVGRWMWVFKK